MKPSKAIAIMRSVIKGNNVPFLLGGTGVGKSAVVFQLAKELSRDKELVRDNICPNDKQFGFIDFRLSLYETVDLGGLPYIDAKGNQCRAFLGNLPKSGCGLLFFDEYAQAHPSVQAVVGQLIYERRLGEYCLPDDWKIICAGNRATDRAGSNKLPSHVVGRCSMIEFESDFNDWNDWAIKQNVHPYVLGYLNFQPQALEQFDSKVLTPQPSPRAWVRFSDSLKTNPESHLIQDLATCDVGEIQAIEFANFLSLMNDVPNLEKIVKGEEVEVVDEVGICYATAVALVNVIKEAKDKVVYSYFENALAYIKQFATPEFAIFFVRQSVANRDILVDSSAFAEFKVEHQDIEY